jgi:hypothetical protein
MERLARCTSSASTADAACSTSRRRVVGLGRKLRIGVPRPFGPERFVEEFPRRSFAPQIRARAFAPDACPLELATAAVAALFREATSRPSNYDRAIFEHKTFRELRAAPFRRAQRHRHRRGRAALVHAGSLRRLCSDLDRLPVARGRHGIVRISHRVSADHVDELSHGAPCDYHAPTWVEELAGDPDTNPPGHALARNWLSYERSGRRYVHLSDGGLADNIGLRAPYHALSVNQWGLSEAINEGRTKKLVVITVDAKPKGESRLDRSARPAGVATVLNAAATKPMENYSDDTVELVRDWFREWDDAARRYDRTQKRCRELAEETCAAAAARTCAEPRRPSVPCKVRRVRGCADPAPEALSRPRALRRDSRCRGAAAPSRHRDSPPTRA